VPVYHTTSKEDFPVFHVVAACGEGSKIHKLPIQVALDRPSPARRTLSSDHQPITVGLDLDHGERWGSRQLPCSLALPGGHVDRIPERHEPGANQVVMEVVEEEGSLKQYQERRALLGS
jgi:hypothetical protein